MWDWAVWDVYVEKTWVYPTWEYPNVHMVKAPRVRPLERDFEWESLPYKYNIIYGLVASTPYSRRESVLKPSDRSICPCSADGEWATACDSVTIPTHQNIGYPVTNGFTTQPATIPSSLPESVIPLHTKIKNRLALIPLSQEFHQWHLLEIRKQMMCG